MALPTIKELMTSLKEQFPRADLSMVELAYEFAAKAHGNQKRLTGEPYVTHNLATAINLAAMRVDLNTVIAGLLHDVPEDTDVTMKEVEKEFGKEVATLVDGVTKLSTLKYRGIERYAENLRKMFVAISKDPRVMLIKFADRINNLETLDVHPPEKRRRIALESMEIFAPIAHRLGMWEVKGELEDLAFKYAEPDEYGWVSKLVAESAPEKGSALQRVMHELRTVLSKQPSVKVYRIEGRAKHLYSLYQKLLRHDRDISQVYDLIAVRVVVESVADCYVVLGLVHQLWKPLRGRIKDYVAQPKPNGYQSLHTTVFVGRDIVEFQIRTKQMDEESNFGVAAHWYYSEKGKPKSGAKAVNKKFSWVQELVKLQKEVQDTTEYLEHVKLRVFPDNIFVFTPKGDVIALPDHSTPVDFAYHIHSDLGDHCTASRVNNKLVPLSTPLKSGDVVEVTIDKNRTRPSQDWLKFVKTRTAREHIKQGLNRSRKILGFFGREHV